MKKFLAIAMMTGALVACDGFPSTERNDDGTRVTNFDPYRVDAEHYRNELNRMVNTLEELCGQDEVDEASLIVVETEDKIKEETDSEDEVKELRDSKDKILDILDKCVKVEDTSPKTS